MHDPITQETEQEQVHIPEYLWHEVLPKKYVIPALIIKLTKRQAKIIGTGTGQHQSNQAQDEDNLLFDEHMQCEIRSWIQSAPEQTVYLKLNNRTAKDLNLFLQQIRTVEDLITVLSVSEYAIEPIEPEKHAYLNLRHYSSEMAQHANHYEIYIKAGLILAICQRFGDHIQQAIPASIVTKIVEMVNIVTPILSHKCQSGELFKFVITAYCTQNKQLITSVSEFRNYDPLPYSLFSKQQLKQHSDKIDIITTREAYDPLFQQNTADSGHTFLEPLLKTVTSKQQIKNYDMSEYFIGNEISNPASLSQWKQFIEEAKSMIK